MGVIPIFADMAKPEDIKALASHFLEKGLDVLVNNAGVAKAFPIGEVARKNFYEIFDINVLGPLLLIRELIPALEKSHARIVNVSSIASIKGVPFASVYAASKAAMEAVTRCLAIELAEKKINVCAVSPGAIDTPLFGKMGRNPEEMKENRKKKESVIPEGRFGDASEIAHVVVAQIESSYARGSIWIVDGGVAAC